MLSGRASSYEKIIRRRWRGVLLAGEASAERSCVV